MAGELENPQLLERETPQGPDIYLFPGQGGLTVGIGRREYEESERARAVFNIADNFMGGDKSISSLCFEGPVEDLSRSENAHVALVTVGIAKLVAGIEAGRITTRPKYVVGCSAGVIPSLVANGVISFREGLEIAKERGILTQEASNGLDAGMETIIAVRSAAGQIERLALEACQQETDEYGGVIAVSGMYSPTSVGLTGDRERMVGVNARLKEHVKTFAPQTGITIVSHSPYMEPAAREFGKFLGKYEGKDPWSPQVMNGDIVRSGRTILSRLPQELLDPVMLTASTNRIIAEGGVNNVTEFANGLDEKPRWARFVGETVGQQIDGFTQTVL